MSRYSHIIKYLSAHPWAIDADRLEAITDAVMLHAAGVRLGSDDIAARLAAARAQQGERSAGGLTGVIPIYGTIMPHANLMTEMSGGTTVDAMRASLHAALGEPDVTRIVFDVDSGGGSVEGITELAGEIRAARGIKPMTSIANYTMGSAAYWLAVQADEVVASPSAMVGSIGVYGVHEDQSGANEKAGVKLTYIASSRAKVEGNPDEPLSDEAAQHLQELVDASADMFVRDVAAARGIPVESVVSGFGNGKAFHAAEALSRGMVDRIATFDEVLSGEAPRARARRLMAAEDEGLDLRAEEAGDAPAEAAPDIFDFEREKRRRRTA